LQHQGAGGGREKNQEEPIHSVTSGKVTLLEACWITLSKMMLPSSLIQAHPAGDGWGLYARKVSKSSMGPESFLRLLAPKISLKEGNQHSAAL
jgi:hypothetical protein